MLEMLFDDFFPFSNNSLIVERSAHKLNDETLELLVPGFKKDDLDIFVENKILNVVSKAPKFGRTIMQRWKLNNVDIDKIDANLEDGILRLKIPKKEQAQEKIKINIK